VSDVKQQANKLYQGNGVLVVCVYQRKPIPLELCVLKPQYCEVILNRFAVNHFLQTIDETVMFSTCFFVASVLCDSAITQLVFLRPIRLKLERIASADMVSFPVAGNLNNTQTTLDHSLS
jgi:hypothetical protein